MLVLLLVCLRDPCWRIVEVRSDDDEPKEEAMQVSLNKMQG